MHDTSICFFTAAEIAKKIRKGEISAVQTMEAHLAQIERINPHVNAIVTFIPELALEGARKADENRQKVETSDLFMGCQSLTRIWYLPKVFAPPSVL